MIANVQPLTRLLFRKNKQATLVNDNKRNEMLFKYGRMNERIVLCVSLDGTLSYT